MYIDLHGKKSIFVQSFMQNILVTKKVVAWNEN